MVAKDGEDARSPRVEVWRRLHFVDVTRLHQRRRWVVCFSSLSRFGDRDARRRMKLALSRAMLQNADILLMDEPTNHLDVMNVKWVKDYIKSLTNVTCIMVSHDSGLLNDVCNHILEIADLKLSCFKGNLAAFVKVRPEARAYFELKSNKLKFHFPKPGPIEGASA